jgi:hypothetical protein
MAGMTTVQNMLKALGSNYNKPPQWADEVVSVWYAQLRPYRDADIHRAAGQIMANRRSLPPIAALLEVLNGDPQTERDRPSGCGACVGTGWRELAVWKQHGQKVSVVVYAAACDCAKGDRYAGGDALPWADAVRRAEADPLTSRVIVTDHQHPRLTLEERLHPDVFERVEQGKIAGPSPDCGSWHKLSGPPGGLP